MELVALDFRRQRPTGLCRPPSPPSGRLVEGTVRRGAGGSMEAVPLGRAESQPATTAFSWLPWQCSGSWMARRLAATECIKEPNHQSLQGGYWQRKCWHLGD